MRILLIGLMLLTTAYKGLTSGSYHGAGLEERVSNCVKDIFDPNNRGSGCN